MKSMALFLSIGLTFAVTSVSAQKTFTRCKAGYLFHAFVEEAATTSSVPAGLEGLQTHFRTLIEEARLAQGYGQTMSVDMLFCDNPVFVGTELQCDKAYEATPFIVGYNSRYLDQRDGNFGTWITSGSRDATAPVSYGRQWGRYMYEADSWLKDQVFEKIVPKWEQEGVEPSSGTIRLAATGGHHETAGFQWVYATLHEETRVIAVEYDGDDDFLHRYKRDVFDNDELERSQIERLEIAVRALFVAQKLEECIGMDDGEIGLLQDRLEVNESLTPTTHPTRIVPIDHNDKQFRFMGGVIADPSVFRIDDNTPRVSNTDVRTINEVIEKIPRNEIEWKVETDSVGYVGWTFR